LIKANEKAIVWQERKGTIETTELEGQDAVIHLAGASIADHRWTPEYKKLIEDSRVRGTHLLAKTLASLKNPPRLFLTASAVGYYGVAHAGERLDESAPG